MAKNLSTKIKSKGDDTYTVSGVLTLPKGGKGKCTGTVSIKVYAGKKLIATYRSDVAAKKAGCSYSKTFTLSDKAAAVSGKRTAQVIFNATSTVHVKHSDTISLPR